jgi:predicted CopG family antitoxin
MTETTTIEITVEQKAQLDEYKQGSKESYKDVLQRLMKDYKPQDTLTETDARRIAKEEINDMVRLEALE